MDAPPIRRKKRASVAIRYDMLDLLRHSLPIRALDGSFKVAVKYQIHDGLIVEMEHVAFGTIHYKIEVKEVLHYERDEQAYADAHRLCTGRQGNHR